MTAKIAAPGIKYAPRAFNATFGSDGSREAANILVEGYRLPNKTLDLSGIALALKAMAKKNPKLAQNTFAEIISRLKPMRQGELQRLVGTSLANPNKQAARASKGQHVLRGVSSASDVLHGSAAAVFKVKGAAKFAPLPAKLVFASVDAKLKYDELRAKGFTHGAANAGMLAGQGSSYAISAAGGGAGTVAGGIIGGLAASPTGPGAVAGAAGGAAVGNIIGSTVAGGIDWYLGTSDKAALAAANAIDGKNIK